MSGIHSGLRRASAFLIGVVFFLSGIFKLMDPVGAGLVVGEYFNFFHVGFLKGASLPVAVILSFVEALTGIALITGVYRKLAAMVAALLTAFFTLVTLVLWIFNPAMDCGCFGEVIHLTHAQTFLKNVGLCLLAAVAFLPARDYGKPRNHRYAAFWIVAVSTAVFAAYSLRYIPLMDFTPFNTSSKLMAAAPAAEGEEDAYVSTFIYEKNGKQGVFTLDRLPDSTWTFVRTETMLRQDNIQETDYPVLSFTDAEGTYCDSLACDPAVMVVSVYDVEALSTPGWEQIRDLLQMSEKAGFTTLLLAASTPAAFPQEQLPGVGKYLYFADYRTLISLNRSNGGATYFNDGNLIRKWARVKYPRQKDLDWMYQHNSTDVMLASDSRGRITFQAFILYAFAMMLFV